MLKTQAAAETDLHKKQEDEYRMAVAELSKKESELVAQ